MRRPEKLATLVLQLSLTVCTGFSQQQQRVASTSHAVVHRDERTNHQYGQLTAEDRLSLVAAALDAKTQSTEPDCSHLVHAIYEEAGLTYAYAPSSELYAGVAGFVRVKKPAAGDLVVWRGHVGIVIRPSQHVFFSDLSTGPGTDNYTTSYWKHRGKPRFYRYVKSALGRPRPLPQLVRTNRERHSTSDSDDRNPQ